MNYLVELGYIGLFLGSFLAATVVPFSSEGLLVGLVYAGFDVYACIALATLGNWLGSLSSFWLGYAGRMDVVEKWFRIKEEKVKTWEPRVKKYATLMALFSWLPLVGDVMAVALGFFRCNFWRMAFFIFVGKLARFVFWGWLTFWYFHK